MTSDQLCLGHHRGGERMRGSTQVSKHRSRGTPGLKAILCSRATQRSIPARPLTWDLAGKYGDLSASQVILQGSNSAGSQNPSPGDSTLGTLYSLDPLGLNQYPRWNDPVLATPVITLGKLRKGRFSSHRSTDW